MARLVLGLLVGRPIAPRIATEIYNVDLARALIPLLAIVCDATGSHHPATVGAVQLGMRRRDASKHGGSGWQRSLCRTIRRLLKGQASD